MAQEIGVAYVSLLPSGKGFSKGVQTEAESAFKGAEKSSDGFFAGVTRWAKRGALVVGGMVASVAALAVGGGISRALNIEDATAKLKGLGHDTKVVEQIMTDALASVKGTAFGLDSAATLAASAVAAGIKPGKELERYLRLTADAATIAGGSLDELGSVMNNVTTLGAAYNDSLQILAQKGLPIYQWLADEIGVTTDEVKNLASQGKISAETFRAAIENNIAGAALSAGDTTRGALANMMSALSRLGVAFVGDGLTGAKTFFKEVTVILDGLETRIGPWVQGIQDKLGGLVNLDGFGEKFLTSLDSFIANFDATPFGILLTTLKPLLPVLQELGAKIGPVLADAFSQVVTAIEPMIPLLAESLVDAIVKLAPPLTDLLIALIPLIPPLVELAVAVLPPLVEILNLLVPLLASGVENLTGWATAFVGAISVMQGDMTFEELGRQALATSGDLSTLYRFFVDTVNNIVGGLAGLQTAWNNGWAAINGVIRAAGAAIVGAAASIWQAVPATFRNGVEAAVGALASLPGRIGAFFAGAGSWLVSAGRSLIQGFINGINGMIGNVGSAISNVLDWAAGFFPHSPAKRGPFSGAGWLEVADGGASLMEQFMVGAEKFKPQIAFTGLAGLSGVAVTSGSRMPSELVIRDVNDQLVGRMGVEAEARIAQNSDVEERISRQRVR